MSIDRDGIRRGTALGAALGQASDRIGEEGNAVEKGTHQRTAHRIAIFTPAKPSNAVRKKMAILRKARFMESRNMNYFDNYGN